MSLQIVQFKPEHALTMDVQESQRMGATQMAEAMRAPVGWAFTALDDGVPIGSAGVIEIWNGRGYAWALLSRHAGRHMAAIHRATLRGLEALDFARIEMAVAAGFDEGCRWARMLGFECESFARKYLPNGDDAHIFVRIK